jgi:PWI domain
MQKVKIDVLKPWITQRITDLLGMEDDVVVEFVFNQLDDDKVVLCFYYGLICANFSHYLAS